MYNFYKIRAAIASIVKYHEIPTLNVPRTAIIVDGFQETGSRTTDKCSVLQYEHDYFSRLCQFNDSSRMF